MEFWTYTEFFAGANTHCLPLTFRATVDRSPRVMLTLHLQLLSDCPL